MEQNKTEKLLPNKVTIHYMKLMNGETIICKSLFDANDMYEMQAVEIFEVIALKKYHFQTQDGLQEALTMAPWLDGADFFQSVIIPLNHIMTTSRLRKDTVIQYIKACIQIGVKEQMIDRIQQQQEEEDTDKDISSDLLNDFHNALRAPEDSFITPKSLYEASMSGELDDIEEELDREEVEQAKALREPDSDPLPYVRDGHIIH